MKRFFDKAAAQPMEGGFGIALDGRPVRTPAKAALLVPTQALADAIAGEWNAQGAKLDPRSMPLTGLANAAIDRIAPDPALFAASLAVFGESDLVAYRADSPPSLIVRQAAAWDPVIDWARRRYDVEFTATTGVIHHPQPAATLERLRAAVAARTPFELAGLNALVTISGSLLIGLAMLEREIDAEAGWLAGHVDELWQAEQWGDDELAQKARVSRRGDFDASARFLSLLH